LSIGLAHLEVSGTPDPVPGLPDRHVLLVSIIYHFVTFLVFITDRPGQMPPPIPLDGWVLIAPAFGVVEYPPMRMVLGTEVTQILRVHSNWLPMVNISAIQRSLTPPQITRPN
jgi:hypothetical protein